MAKYYGTLKDGSEKQKSRRFYKILSICFFALCVIFVVCALVGIFGDTARRDKTRQIVVENSELKQQVAKLETDIEKLEKENAELLETLEKNFIEAGATLSKPEGDLTDGKKEAENDEESEDSELENNAKSE